MLQDRKYPISESKFQEMIEPFIKKEQKKSGRPTRVSHYNFFWGAIRTKDSSVMERSA